MVCGAAHRGKGFLGPNSTAERRNKACNRKYKGCVEEYLSVEQVAALAQTDYGAAVLEFTVNCNEQGQPVLSFSPSSAVAQYRDPRAGGARGMFGYAFLSAVPKLYGHNSTHGAKTCNTIYNP